MSNAVFRKTMEMWKNRKKKKIFWVRTKLSYYKVVHRTFISNREKKTEILMNAAVCEAANLCYMDTDSFIVYIKADGI